MSNLTRYTMVVRRDHEGFATAAGKVRQQGEWVKFEDHVESLSKAYNTARDVICRCNSGSSFAGSFDIKNNGMVYCPYCGGKLTPVA